MSFAKASLAAGFFMAVICAVGQVPIDGIHYPAGLNGSRAGILDSPGVYLRDDNLIYSATADQPVDFRTLIYVQAPQLMWLTGWKIFGANIGADVMVPIIYKEANFRFRFLSPVLLLGPPTSESRFGIGDIKIEPLLLAWHWEHYDLMAAYAIWAPTGHYQVEDMDNLGNGQWTHMITLGAVWYPDDDKTWSVSILHHYEVNTSQTGSFLNDKGVPPAPIFEAYRKISASTYTMECAVSKTIFDHTDVGLAGYYQQQFSDADSANNPNKDSEVAGAGPEVSVLIPKWNLSASLRYAYEFAAHDRPRGDTVDLSVTKKF